MCRVKIKMSDDDGIPKTDFKIIRCRHWHPRRKATCGAYCRLCDTVILSCFCSIPELIDTINHEVFHAVFCRWGFCSACEGLDRLGRFDRERQKRGKRLGLD